MSMVVRMFGLGMAVVAVVWASGVQAEPGPESGMVAKMEKAHAAAAYRSKTAVCAEFHAVFPGAFELKGTMEFDTALSKARMDLADGTVVVFDGETAWAKTKDGSAPSPMLRFHVLTWPYFLAAPFKMSDPGVKIGPDDTERGAAGRPFQEPSAKVTFEAGTGDAPDDWYYLFLNGDGRLEAMSYIVTYGKTKEQAEVQPSIIVYKGYQEVEGVPFSTEWSFHLWDKGLGVKPGKGKGTAKLSGIEFVEPAADAFVKPEGAVELKLPGG